VTPPKAVEEEILDRFETLMRRAAGSHTPEFLGVDVTMPQAKVLYLVALQPDLPMSGIAAELGVGAPAVSGLVDRLVALGYVERREDPADRRQQLVGITDAGTTALERLRELNTNAMRRLIAGLDPEELEALRISLIALDREVQHLFGGGAHTDLDDRPERTSA
jgi:DNA-binding MarR family transcriptional regulator